MRLKFPFVQDQNSRIQVRNMCSCEMVTRLYTLGWDSVMYIVCMGPAMWSRPWQGRLSCFQGCWERPGRVWRLLPLVGDLLRYRKPQIINLKKKEKNIDQSQQSVLIWSGGYKTSFMLILTQLSTKFQLLIKTKIPTNEEVSCFKSLRCCTYHANKC